jgi:hypothetical protein
MLLKGLNESPFNKPLLKSCFLDIDKKEMEKVNRGGQKASKHVKLWVKMHLMNGKCFKVLTCRN